MNDYDEDKPTVCACCGAKTVVYTHKLNAGSAIAMKRLYEAGGRKHIKFLGLTHDQRCNFQKLKHWELVGNTDGRKNGVWELTGTGVNFVEGKTAVLSHAASYRGERVELPPRTKKSASPVLFSEIYPYALQDEEITRYKQRDEYADDAEPFDDYF